jgi:TusA-related sulfurtransferase
MSRRCEMKPDQVLDCVGLYCPMPIARTAQKMEEMEEGQVLKVIADDPGIKEDMPAWCRKTGHELISMEEKEGEIHIMVRKAKSG